MAACRLEVEVRESAHVDDCAGALRTGGKYLKLYSRVSQCEVRKIEVHCIETAKAKRKEKVVSSGFSELNYFPLLLSYCAC